MAQNLGGREDHKDKFWHLVREYRDACKDSKGGRDWTQAEIDRYASDTEFVLSCRIWSFVSSYSVIELLKKPPEPKPMEFYNLKRRYQVLTIAGRDWLIKTQGFEF